MAEQEWYQSLKIVGTSFRTEALNKILDGRDYAVVVVRLEPEPENAFDPHAIAAFVQDEHVGYIPRNQTEQVQAHLDSNGQVAAKIPAYVYKLQATHTPSVVLGRIPSASRPQKDYILRLLSDLDELTDAKQAKVEQLDLREASILLNRLVSLKRDQAYSDVSWRASSIPFEEQFSPDYSQLPPDHDLGPDA